MELQQGSTNSEILSITLTTGKLGIEDQGLTVNLEEEASAYSAMKTTSNKKAGQKMLHWATYSDPAIWRVN